MMTDPGPLLILVTGPTAIGKTHVAIELARKFKTEIISSDSRQFYRELNIGVARPSEAELKAVPHHLIGFLPVTEPYNVYRFETEVLSLCRKLFQQTNRLIMAGGSGLYNHAVTHGIDHMPDPDPILRHYLRNKLETEGIEALQKQLRRLDPDYFHEVDRDNPKRLIRALEVCLTTGRTFSSLRTGKPAARPFHIFKIGLNMDRGRLYERINTRVDQMMERGLLDEVRSLLPWKGINALNTVGYTELFAYFDGQYSLAEAIEKIKIHTRRYAKRQLTWFRNDPEICWFEPEDIEGIEDRINRFSKCI